MLLDGRRANACLALAVAHDGAEITTVEGLADGGELHPLQAAFIEHDALPVRLLHARPDLLGRRHARRGRGGGPATSPTTSTAADARRRRDPRAHERQPLPLRRLREHRRRDRGRRRDEAVRLRAAPATRRAAVAAADRGATLPRRRHQPRRPDEARRREPALLVDVRRLPLDAIEETARRRRCASAPPCATADLAAHPVVRERYPVLSQALLAGASGQLRNLATVGGNLLQRTRCAYFQDVTKPCNKRAPGSRLPGARGRPPQPRDPRASEHCVATHPSDMAVALAALDAIVHVLGADGERTIPLADLHRLPGDEPAARHRARAGRADHRRRAAAAARAARSAYRKVRDRASFAFALVSVAAALDVDGRHVARRRASRSAASPTSPGGAERAEAALRGAAGHRGELPPPPPTPSSTAAQPLRDNAFKVPLARNVVVRTLAGPARATDDRRDRHARRRRRRSTASTGREKVTGAARYAFEHAGRRRRLRVAVVQSTIAAGAIDAHRRRRGARAARRARRPHPRQRAAARRDRRRRAAASCSPTTVALPRPDRRRGRRRDARGRRARRPTLVRVDYDAERARRRAPRRPPRPLRAREGQPDVPDRHRPGRRRRPRSRDAAVVVDATYATPAEPQQPDGAARHASRCWEDDDLLTLYDSTQGACARARRRSPRCSASTPEQRARRLPARRRRLRLQGHAAPARRCSPRSPRRSSAAR